MSIHFIEKIDDTKLPEHFAPLDVAPLMPNFGARIRGIDLTSDLSDEMRSTLRKAWLAYGVVIFPGQPTLTVDQHLAVATTFGKPDSGSPFVEKLTAEVDVITTDSSRPPVSKLWHSDNTTLEEPSHGTMIQIQRCPPIGGNTSWISATKAYRCLSSNMKRYLDGLTAVHYWDSRGRKEPVYLNATFDPQEYLRRVTRLPPRRWPVVCVHPVTGEKSIHVNETYTTYIEGMHVYESKAILDFLYSWMRMPEFYVSHNWAPNDVAVWDNFSMQHYGLAD